MTGKQELRLQARARREMLAAAMPDFSARIAAHAEALGFEPGMLIGGYAALPGEADPDLLLARLEEKGFALAFPRVAAEGVPLSFHRVPAGGVLARGAFGVAEPPPGEEVRPGAVLVPLLAFDGEGHRLGYGGGYYDRTLAALKSSHRVRAIGIAYGGQEVALLPCEAHDHPLDAILTEQGLRQFK